MNPFQRRHVDALEAVAEEGEPLFDRLALAARLKAVTAHKGLTVREVANKAGVSAATVSRATRGERLDVESWFRLERWIDPGFDRVLQAIRAHAGKSYEGA